MQTATRLGNFGMRAGIIPPKSRRISRQELRRLQWLVFHRHSGPIYPTLGLRTPELGPNADGSWDVVAFCDGHVANSLLVLLRQTHCRWLSAWVRIRIDNVARRFDGDQWPASLINLTESNDSPNMQRNWQRTVWPIGSRRPRESRQPDKGY